MDLAVMIILAPLAGWKISELVSAVYDWRFKRSSGSSSQRAVCTCPPDVWQFDCPVHPVEAGIPPDGTWNGHPPTGSPSSHPMRGG